VHGLPEVPASDASALVRVERAAGDDQVPAGAVAHVILDRPEALNAISTELARRLGDLLTDLAADDDLRAVVLSSSSPKAFCVGADLKERNGYTDEQLRAQRVVYRRMAAALLAVPVPVVAAVAGYALGGGLELALLSDLVVADETAVVGLPEVSVGVIPGLGGTQLLPRRIGTARAAELVYTARRLDAAEAGALGVVDRVVPAGEALAAASDLAAAIARNSPVGVRNAKRAIRLGTGTDLASALEIEDGAWRATAFSADRAEGVRAFAEKRPPRWPGRDPG
jgi:enoyl-CoA hydratase/carnithine racemase